MKISFEKINKILMFIALLSLIFRRGNFYNSFIPKPFELFFTLLVILTAIYAIKNGKIKDFFLSIPRKIWIAVFCLIFSILAGWAFAILFKKLPSNFNMVLEFGTFTIGLGMFLLILFYTKDDQAYVKKYFYALLFPTIYIFFVLFPGLADHFLLADGNFLGFTSNQNVISKTLLIPALFFIASSLFDFRNKWLKIGCIFISSALVALLFWISSRGALFSLALGSIFVWLVFSLNNFHWKKMVSSGVIIFIIISLGFAMTPNLRKKVVLSRMLNIENNQTNYILLENKSINNVIQESFDTYINQNVSVNTSNNKKPVDSRLQIWSFYLKHALRNPLGIGPDTHMKSYIVGPGGEYVSSGPHNTYIQILLWGGLLGLLSFLFILFSAFRNLKEKLQSDFSYMALALLSILFVLSVSIMFDDSLGFYWFFVILALSLRI